MVSSENILLRLTEDHEDEVRRIYAELARRGFPPQKQRPHVTVTFAAAMPRRVVGEAAVLLPPCVPARLRRAGTVVFGTKSKQTVAWLLEAPPDLDAACRAVSALNPEGRGHGWIPHLTVGLRIPKLLVPGYIEALAEVTSTHVTYVEADRAAFYQPGLGREFTF